MLVDQYDDMVTPTLTLRAADETTIAYVESLLEANGLPAADVREKPTWFYSGYNDGDRVGMCGLERYGSDDLLRSLVVEESARENGVGTALCAELEEIVRTNGIETVYLLTTTAAEFFDARGYTAVDRSEPPALTQQTSEFADLCPETAVCMRKSV